jgi:DNA repair photolyase
MGMSQMDEKLQTVQKVQAIKVKKSREIIDKKEKSQHFITDKARKSTNQSSYRTIIPIVKPSKLASKENGGIGKDLSEGWAVNFAIGCTHACTFCYVDSIHRRYRGKALGFADIPWGHYFLIPNNLEEAIEMTKWSAWSGKEVMLSSTHDPYLPQLAKHTRQILELALPEGVRFCVQTRSPLVRRDFGLLEEYKNQVRIQISIATMENEFARAIEPNVALPGARFKIIKEAKTRGLTTGIILAPIFPAIRLRPDPEDDLERMIEQVIESRPNYIYGECLHARGTNLTWTEQAIKERITNTILRNFDRDFQVIFRRLLKHHGLHGEWWPDHRMQIRDRKNTGPS